MSEFTPVSTLADLSVLNDDEMVSGYLAGFNGDAEPGSDKSKSFWHGWRNGCVDSGRTQIDAHQVNLAQAVVAMWQAH